MTDPQSVTQTTTQAMTGRATDEMRKTAMAYPVTRQIGEKGIDVLGNAVRRTTTGQAIMGEAAEASFKETRQGFLQRVQKETFEYMAERTGHAVAGKVAGKAAKHVAKSATRFAPGVGAISGGIFAAVQVHNDKSEMKEQYGGIISNFFSRIGEMVAPRDVEYRHVKEYAKANPIVGEEIDNMWTQAKKEVGYGALGFAGTAIQIGEEGVKAYRQDYSTAEWADILADYRRSGGEVDKGHVLLMVESAYKDSPEHHSANLSDAQWEAREGMAELCAEKLNSREMSFYDMVSFIGEGAFVEQSQEICMEDLCAQEEMKDIIAQYKGAINQPAADLERNLDEHLTSINAAVDGTYVNQPIVLAQIQLEEVDCCEDIIMTSAVAQPIVGNSARAL